MSQHVATWWPNARNILYPTMLRYVGLKCYDRLAGALGGRTQFLLALLLMRFSARTGIARNKHAVDTAITLFAQFPHYLCYFSSIERSVLIVLVFYYECMLGKVTMQRTQQFSAFPQPRSQGRERTLGTKLSFSIVAKRSYNVVKYRACAVS